jgi:hypothetical protein
MKNFDYLYTAIGGWLSPPRRLMIVCQPKAAGGGSKFGTPGNSSTAVAWFF